MWQNQGGFNQSGFDGPTGPGFQSPGGFGTPSQGQEKKTRNRAKNILPCTVAQIFNATLDEDKFFSGDIELQQITMVGLVRTVKESPTRLDYEIDDMTGPSLEVKQFVDNDESVPDEERVQTMRENTYVRVCGHVRSFAGKRSVVAFRIMPITDMNELTCHLLEVIQAHITLSAPQQSLNSDSGPTRMDTNVNTGGTIPGLSPLQSQLQLIIKNNPSDTGASIHDICKELRNISGKEIRDAVEFLSSEGHIYSTIDDDHYKATDG
ncbi:replication protein A 32 kDa subunit-like [Gigantopelta aegis]|uniref:replication protein A 32 kDa subunit-like n=1 Tax=Gigantopelta aegis TaxID=1735272 RepID=UPI001B888901|nr:replication protein A 32 kDa subunit-like [Gigantopelta aegis]